MKLNDINEVSFGGAMMTQLGKKMNPFNRSGESSLSIQDRMAQQQFVKDLVGRASVALKQGISSGLIDPSTKIAKVSAATAPATAIGSKVQPAISTTTPAAATQGSAPVPSKQEPIKIGGQTLDPKNPADKKIIDKIQAQQSSGKKTPAAAPAAATTAAPAAATTAAPAAPAAPKTPEQIRIEKQKIAAAQAQSQMKPKPVAPAAPAAKTPAEIRAEKQGAAAQAAQAQMKPKPVAPAAKTPAEIRAEKQGAAAQAAQAQMKPKAAVWKSNRNPARGAKTSPKFEDSYKKLNAIFESIIDIDEAAKTYPYTISSYLENFLKQYMGGMDISALKPMADQVQKSWRLGGGGSALQKLASAAYSLYSTGGANAGEKVTDKEKTDATADAGTSKGPSLVDIYSGDAEKSNTASQAAQTTGAVASSPAGTTTPTAITTPAGTSSTSPADTPSTAPTPAPIPAKSNAMEPAKASPEKVKSVYMQVKDLVNKLDKKGKQRILSTLEKEVGAEPSVKATAKTDTTSAGANAFGQMAGQLAARPTPSSTGGTTTGVSGVGSGVVRHTAGKGTKVKQAKALKQKQTAAPTAPVAKKTKKASPLPVAESKTFKVWGQK